MTGALRQKRPVWLLGFGIFSFVLFGIGAYLGLVYSPPDVNQGELIRMMYAHVSAVWVGFVAVLITGIFGMLYLWRGRTSDDAWALASAELALVYFALAIIGGMTYSRPTLGTFWDWDAKLTLTALAFALLVGYFIVRGLIDDPQRRGRVSAIVSLMVLTSLPFNWMAARWFRTLHPAKSFDVTADGVRDTMAPVFRWILLFNVLAAACIFVYLLIERARVAKLELSQQESVEPGTSAEVIRV